MSERKPGNGQMSQTNEQAAALAAKMAEQPGPEQVASAMTAAQDLLGQLQAPFHMVIGTMLAGLLARTHGVAPHVVLNLICWQVGNICAETIQADLVTLLTLRKGLKEAFEDGVKQAKMTPPPIAPAPADGKFGPLPGVGK